MTAPEERFRIIPPITDQGVWLRKPQGEDIIPLQGYLVPDGGKSFDPPESPTEVKA